MKLISEERSCLDTRYFEYSSTAWILAVDLIVQQHHITGGLREFSAVAFVHIARNLV